MGIKSTVLGATALILSTSVNAAIIDLGNITRDTGTGLDWLDVTETRGMSYNDVVAQLGTGGTYEGWRYATGSEVDGLLYNLGFGALATPDGAVCQATGTDFCMPSPTAQYPSYTSLLQDTIALLGDTRAEYVSQFDDPSPYIGSTWGIPGYHGIDAIIADQYGGDQLHSRIHYEADQLYTTLDTVSSSFAYVDKGSFLVKSVAVSTVPVPAAAWLFGSGLLGIIGVARRKKAA